MKTVVFVPRKMNNGWFLWKNKRYFKDGIQLIPFILKKLFEKEKVNEVCAYCNREEIRKYMLYGMHYRRRDEKYDRMVLLGASFVKKEFGGAV